MHGLRDFLGCERPGHEDRIARCVMTCGSMYAWNSQMTRMMTPRFFRRAPEDRRLRILEVEVVENRERLEARRSRRP